VTRLLALTFLTACWTFAGADHRPDFRRGGWTALLNGRDLNGWMVSGSKGNTWFTTAKVALAADPKRLAANAEPGGIMVNGPDGRTSNFLTAGKFGDVELYVEFLVASKSNSGVYLQGLYEVQVFDSHGVASPGVHDCGAIYERWIDGKGVGGSAPRQNASRPPGEWQSFHIWFRAPRFDSSGRKTENARFLKVLHNGILVQENVEVDGPTRASMTYAEGVELPLMLQGDHGPVAYRSLWLRKLTSPR
jgi:hypothetical protein